MKRKLSLLLAGSLFITCLIPGQTQAATSPSLSAKRITITKGSRKKLSVKHAKKKVKWSVKTGKKQISLSAKKKYSVLIKAKKKGTAKVQAKTGKRNLICRVTVKEKDRAKVTAVPQPMTPTDRQGTASPIKPGESPTATPGESPTAPPTVSPTASPEPGLSEPLDLSVDFADFSTHGFQGRGKGNVEVEVVATDPIDQKPALFVTGRDENWNGVQYDLTKQVRRNATHYFTVEVMHTNSQNLNIDMSLDTGNGYPGISQKAVPANTWTTLSGSYYVSDEQRIVWYVQVTNHATADFYIRNIKMYEEKEDDMSDVLAYESLAKSAEQYGFSIGTVIDGNLARRKKYQTVVDRHFNSLTAGNEMKAYSLLDQKASQASDDGMPRMNYEGADVIMQFAVDHGMKVRGHCLVWDYKMNDWFFRENYTDDGSYVSEDVARKRLESYIKQVVEHFDTKFPGIVYCWDVVNEAVGGEGFYTEGDPCRVRTRRNTDGEITENLFYRIFGRDYIKLAFQYARKYCAEGTKLYYNDYFCENEQKCTAVINLVNNVNADEKLIDGIGSQVRLWSVNDDTIDKVRISLQRLSGECNVEVQVTELTPENTNMDDSEHALWYYKLFEMYKELVQENHVPLTNISIWELTDAVASESCFGLFTSDYHAKKTLEAVSCSLQGKSYPSN